MRTLAFVLFLLLSIFWGVWGAFVTATSAFFDEPWGQALVGLGFIGLGVLFGWCAYRIDKADTP